MPQPYNFFVADAYAARAAGVPLPALHQDGDAILKASDAAAKLCHRLGEKPPPPRLAGLGYVHVSTIGVRIEHRLGEEEPAAIPCIHSPQQIDDLREPEDYLASGVVPQRLALLRQLQSRRPDASTSIGHDFEGPVTTAVLMMGPDFLMLPYDDPARAHRLLDFAVTSAINYTRAIRAHQSRPLGGQPEGIPDDFAGMFPPEMFRQFVLPYWQRLYEGLGATTRLLHSELLREVHLPFLEELRIETFDSAVDQYLPPETLARSCRVPYGLRIWPAHMRVLPTGKLVAMYRRFAGYNTRYITFSIEHPDDEPKVAAVLKVARELAA